MINIRFFLILLIFFIKIINLKSKGYKIYPIPWRKVLSLSLTTKSLANKNYYLTIFQKLLLKN